MELLKKVREQERAEALLMGSFTRDRVAHAYLFAGPVGVGRLTAALEFAAAWMCLEDTGGYCGTCRNCTRVFRFQHPDVRLTMPVMASTKPEEISDLLQQRVEDGITPVRLQGNTRIGIDQIRELEGRLSKKAYEDRGHIEILIDADRMGVEASNALLKTLEEPPDETVIILISSRWSALLPTVRSRSHLVRFRRLGVDAIRGILKDRLGIEGEKAEKLARTCDGRPGVALARAGGTDSSDPDCLPLDVFRKITGCRSFAQVLDLSSEVARKIGRHGGIEFCRSMQTLLHDIRRMGKGMPPIGNQPGDIDDIVISDECMEAGIRLFSDAEMRIAGNGLERLVMAAAFSGIWKKMMEANE